MAYKKVYRVEESGPRGKFAVAVRDIQAGEMVSEEEALLFFRKHQDAGNPMDYIVLNYEVVVAVGMEMMWSA